MGRAWISQNGKPKGVINLIHGLGEHSGRYAPVAEVLTAAGHHVIAFDLRGHGLSGGKRGHAMGFEQLAEDMDVFLQESKERYGEDLPTFLYGHSLGAAMVLYYGFNRPINLQGAVITSPPLATTTKTSEFKKSIARILAQIAPALTMNNDLPVDGLSRDKAICKAYQDDPYVHNKISARLGLDILNSGETFLAMAEKWQIPMLLMHGTADPIVDYRASEKFAQARPDLIDLVLWEGYYHETHNDIGKEKVLAKMVSWLDKKCQQQA